ncbi:MAG: alpha/beta-hydrolase family protein [Phycicoccus sp.]|nr:alpha/beta-hydrolase family protein [Phycicoccus sp.]
MVGKGAGNRSGVREIAASGGELVVREPTVRRPGAAAATTFPRTPEDVAHSLVTRAMASIRRWGFSVPGVIVGLAFVIMSTAPSLLPRIWYLQGALSGVSFSIGYSMGLVLWVVLRAVAGLVGLRITVSRTAGRTLRLGSVALGVVLAVWTTVANIRSQNTTAVLVGLRPLSPIEWVGAGGAAVAVATGIIAVGCGIRAAYRLLQRRIDVWVPRAAATILAAAATATVTVLLTDVVVVNNVAAVINRVAASTNAAVPRADPPTSRLRTGGPGSTVEYSSLGFEGQRFVTNGATKKLIEQASGSPALEPIRAYSGLPADGDLEAAADTVVAELRRTGAFERSVIAVFITTGTGWINEWSAQSVEYLTGGDCAIAAMQYSYLPSPVAFVADVRTPVDAARALIGAVEAAVAQLPEGQRPRLMVSGESLGAFGGNGAFTDVNNLLDRVDGAVWSGTPRFTPLLDQIEQQRVQGSPEISPVLDSGRQVRFVSNGAGLTADYVGRVFPEWETPRIAYVQHPSDPVVWFQPQTGLSQPDWLREPRGRDVNPSMNWLPVVTFWQLAGDLAVGLAPPYGHGHRYGPELVAVWAAVLGGHPGDNYETLISAMRPHVPTAE